MVRGLLMCVLVAAAGCARHRPPAAAPAEVAVLYTGDLRGVMTPAPGAPGGLGRRATLVDRVRLSGPAVVQVDAGDLAPGPEDSPDFADPAIRGEQARLLLRAYRRMGVDAITVGERDLALGADRWRALCDEAKVPVVAANLIGAGGRPLFAPTRIFHAGQVTVGVFGLLEVTGWTPPPGVTVTDASAAARAAVATLRGQGARVVVGLFHVAGGLTRARQIAAAAGPIDLVVLGHTGPAAPPRDVHVRAGGVELGRADIRLEGPGPAQVEDHLLAVEADVPEQTGVRLLARVAAGPISPTFADSVAKLSKAAGVRQYGESWTYGSTPLCAGCHPTQAAQWKTTDHARAYATLVSAGKARDPACMGCHLTGFLLPGGAQNFESAVQFADVGCEACHGPSVAHVVSTDKRKGTSRRVDPAVCLGCHTPDQNIGPFDVVAALKEVVGPGHGLPSTPPAAR